MYTYKLKEFVETMKDDSKLKITYLKGVDKK